MSLLTNKILLNRAFKTQIRWFVGKWREVASNCLTIKWRQDSRLVPEVEGWVDQVCDQWQKFLKAVSYGTKYKGNKLGNCTALSKHLDDNNYSDASWKFLGCWMIIWIENSTLGVLRYARQDHPHQCMASLFLHARTVSMLQYGRSTDCRLDWADFATIRNSAEWGISSKSCS